MKKGKVVPFTHDHTANQPAFSQWSAEDDAKFDQYLDGTPNTQIPTVTSWDKPKHTTHTPACHTTHKPLPIVVDDVTYEIYGGSCINPIVKDMDVFVGLDAGMSRTTRMYPWVEGTEFLYYISDMKAPTNAEDFKLFINFLKDSLIAGKKVFVGCLGGHGRTGTVFSALVKVMTGMEDATTYVRTNYCKKAVESYEQIGFLHNHFGISKVTPTKQFATFGNEPAGYKKSSQKYSSIAGGGKSYSKTLSTVTPVPVEGHLHGKNKIKVKH